MAPIGLERFPGMDHGICAPDATARATYARMRTWNANCPNLIAIN